MESLVSKETQVWQLRMANVSPNQLDLGLFKILAIRLTRWLLVFWPGNRCPGQAQLDQAVSLSVDRESVL